jgi:hypothetical protein
MAFLTMNLARADQLLRHPATPKDFVLSTEDAKRRAYNELFVDRIFRFLPYHNSLECFLETAFRTTFLELTKLAPKLSVLAFRTAFLRIRLEKLPDY